METIRYDGLVPSGDPHISYQGRWLPDEKSFVCSFEGHLSLRFRSSSVMLAGPASGSAYLVLDHGEPQSITLSDGLVLAENLAEGEHLLSLYAPWQLSFIRVGGFRLDENARTFPIRPTATVEFIGDSIMEGYCNPIDGCEKFGNNSSMISYATLTGRKLAKEKDIAFNVIAYGGIGIGAGPRPNFDFMVMADRYRKVREFRHDDTPETPVADWDFSRFVPDHLCINLGTNDWGVPSDTFKEKYHAFLTDLKADYPRLKTIVLMTPFCGTKAEEIRQVVEEEADPRVILCDSALWGIPNGSKDVHPSPASHEIAAEKLADFLGKLL